MVLDAVDALHQLGHEAVVILNTQNDLSLALQLDMELEFERINHVITPIKENMDTTSLLPISSGLLPSVNKGKG